MTTLRVRPFRSIVTILIAAAAPVLAVVPPQDDPLARFEYRHPEIAVPQAYEAAAGVAGVDARVLRALGSPLDASYVDLRTGRWARLMPATPLLPGRGVGNTLTWEALGAAAPDGERELAARAWDAFAAWLARHAGALGIDPTEVVSPGRVTVYSPDHIQIWSPRRVAGLPVRDSSLSATLRHGNLVLFGAENWGDLDAPGFAELDAAAASAVLARHLGAQPLGGVWAAPELTWVPVSTRDTVTAERAGDGLGYRLAWTLRYDLGQADGRWEALVDARDGTLLSFVDTHQHATTRRVTGGVYPVSNDGTPPDGTEQPGWPMPYADVTVGADTLVTDAGGNLEVCADGSISASLSGPFVRIADQCGASSLSGTGDLDFGVSAGTDCQTPGFGGSGNTHSARSGFFEINQLKAMARAQLPANAWLQGQLTANMNIPQACNANWNGSAVNFFRSSGSCRNTGEIAGIFDHEWGHGMDDNDAVPTIANPGEGIADIYGSLRLDDSCVGRGFFRFGVCSGYGNPCTVCSGVRDIDWALRVANTPTTVTWINNNCGGGPAPCGGIVHCEGAVYAEAVWDLWNRDLVAAPFNLSENHAREIATQLTYRGAGAVTSWFTCNQGNGGCGATNGYLLYLAADDDNGNLNDGTPHMTAIHAAYNRHGIACATPAPVNSGCAGAPTTAPTVSALARDRGAKLTWSAVPSATEYRVYRTDGVFGCDFGKVLIGTTDGLEFADGGLQNGRTYSYIVVPMGASDVCLGPASSCTQVTPAPSGSPSAAVTRASFVAFGDGDAFVDNCEVTGLAVPIANVGGVTLTDLEIVSASSPSHPATTFPGPFPIAVASSLAGCDEAIAYLQFIPSGLAPDDLLEVEIEVDAVELGGDTRLFTLSYDATEGDFQLIASRQFDFEADAEGWTTISGIFQRDTTGGGAGGSTAYLESSEFLNNQCDIVRSPRLKLAANSTLQTSTRIQIEPMGGQWWDRANLGIFQPATGQRTVISPSAGRLYNASGPNGTCGTEGQVGWGGSQNAWATSDWTATDLQTGTFAGELIQLQFNYGTNAAGNGDGLHFDQLTVTGASWQVPDAQPDACGASLLIFADGFETSDTSRWSQTAP